MSILPMAGRNFTGLQLLLPGAQELGWSHAASENPQGSKQIYGRRPSLCRQRPTN